MNEKEKLGLFEKSLKIKFNNQAIIYEALRHRSYLNEHKDVQLASNERLEFLGDAVLELVSTEYLFGKYPDRAEGDLTSFRAALVRTESLAETSLQLGVSDYLYMSKGEEATGGRTRPYILANAFEAIIGAIYLDQGYEAVKKFIYDNLIPKVDRIVKERLDIDNKSKLQEISQDVLKLTPTYEVISEIGPDHNKKFEVAVLIGNKTYGKGTGKSKQEAEQSAAKAALESWH
jgi:ribonuclease III